MRSYYSTFIPGLAEPVKQALTEALPGARIILALDGLVVYESDAKAETIQSLPFVTNSFYVIRSFPRRAAAVADLARRILADRAFAPKLPVPYDRRGTFRIVVSVANQLVQIDDELMLALERRVAAATGLRTNRAKPDFEFWLSQRSEGYGFFAFRLSHHRAYDKSLQRGELRPELANVLCRLSEPAPDELFLDPFCGSGAIPVQRARFFPKGLVIASDADEQKVAALKARIKEMGLAKRVVVRRDDALNLARYQDGSIHKIVTDPPWGHFAQTSSPLADFYARALAESARVLRPGGRAVVLTGEVAAFEEGLDRLSSQLTVARRYNILLSGKKASAYVLLKRTGGREARRAER